MPRIPKVILQIESSRASGRALLRGIANYANHCGPWSFYWEAGGLENLWPLLRTSEADGIILRDAENAEQAMSFGIPAVFIGHQQTEIPGRVNVVTDSESIGRMGADHLIACGFKHFAFCGYAKTAYEKTPWSEARRNSFSKHIRAAGYEEPARYELGNSDRAWSDERPSMARWLETLPKPLGLMACNDDCGGQVMEACKVAGLTVPDAVGVIGVDNDEVVCNLTGPPMSSVAINFERAGHEAAQALHSMMQGMQYFSQRITAAPTYVLARRSTDFVAAEEPHVARALRFIREHAADSVSVDQIAQSSGFSRRALEKRFRIQLGRSILEEVKRVRTDEIARMLLETDLPVSEIATLLGFADIQHVARYFRASKRLSPIAYRKAFRNHNGVMFPRSRNGDSFPQSGVVGRRTRQL
jgi:LacI family transcriptional regulator, galactose operon repressor